MESGMEPEFTIDFSGILQADTPDARKSKIREILASTDWDDLLSEACGRNGGWPEHAIFEDSDISDLGHEIKILGTLSYSECRPSSCKDMNYETAQWTKLRITAKRELNFSDAFVQDLGGPKDAENPGDYN